MNVLAWTLAIAVSASAPAAPADAPANGSFEVVTPAGLPAQWGAVGQTVETSSDARSGRRALRLLRTRDTQTLETGVNDALGTPGKPLAGGLDFWYKAIAADNAKLNVYVIPMGAEGVENTGAPRATFTAPAEHVGDGQWHHVRLKYDFSNNPKVKWVHFAARIVGTAGELLLDDLAYIERVGPMLRFGKIRLEEDADLPGRRGTLRAELENAGDVAVKDARVKVALPDGVRATPAEVRLGDLAVDAKTWVTWTLDGPRSNAAVLRLTAAGEPAVATASFSLRPALVVRSFGPVAPVAKGGRPIAVECVLENPASATVVRPTVEFAASTGKATRTVEQLPPGQTVLLRADLPGAGETLDLPIFLRASAENAVEKPTATARVVVGSAAELPAPAGKLQAAVTPQAAVLENEHLRLGFRVNTFGFGPGELQVKAAGGWQTAAWLPRLGRVVYRDAKDHRQEQVVFGANASNVDSGGRAAIRFEWSSRAAPTAAFRLRVTFALAPGKKHLSAQYELTAGNAEVGLLALEGPMLYVVDRDEAVFPGLEWLVGDEVSSGTLDIAEGHKDQVRYVVHPNMITIPAIGVHSPAGTVGLIWDVHQPWDGARDRPSAVFASPDRFQHQRSHLMGLFLPTVPEFVKPNEREAATPYAIAPGKTLRLACQIHADGAAADALAAIDQWACLYGLPAPAPLPRGSYQREIEFSMKGYLESLWDAETGQWWTSKGGGVLSTKGLPRAYVADLLLGELLSPDEAVRRACRARAEEVLARIGGEARLDAQRFFGRAETAMANPGAAAALLATRGDDGAWRFDADQKAGVPFEGMDYHEIGPDNAVEVGTCAQRAYQILRFARIAGDQAAYQQMEKTLELMETFRVPRAAQVWEVPVHTPDLLAAADAVDAYLEAYRFSGNARWLRNAVVWARRGLPFIYLWNDPDKPFLLGASIPVFGASWHQWSWFGRPVQWNGLRYAEAILKLAEHDQTYPWRQIAETIIRSAIHQQDAEGPNAALWPDSIGAIDCQKSAWVFAPRQILGAVLRLMGRDEAPATVMVGTPERRFHLTATGKISEAVWDGKELRFKVAYPRGEQGVVLVANVVRPDAVELDAKPIPERAEVEQGPEPGWRYDGGNAFLAVRVARDGESAVRVRGASFQAVERLPKLATRIDFEFRDSLHGWIPMHHMEPLSVGDGMLVGRITGGDPYLGRSMLRVRGDDYPVLRLRMRLTAGVGGQLFWGTETEPGFAEQRSIRFDLKADGQMHEYRLEPGKHALWSGQTITALRLDPGNGAPGAEFAIESLRGGKD